MFRSSLPEALVISLLLLAVICPKEASAVQTFQEEPRYTEVNPTDSALLNCKVYNMRGTCSWQKDGRPQGLFTGKYEWSGDRTAGDCSLRVLDVAEVDDGEWECQVTASAFTAQDALTSHIARLVVRVAPDTPYLEVGHTHALAGKNFTVREGRAASIKCIARYGNPAARFKWFIGSEELPATAYNLSNSTEPDRPKLWRSTSVLQTSYAKDDHGRQVRCVAVHEAYDSRTVDVAVLLDVQYVPTVSLHGAPVDDIEEGVDNVSLKCVADSNPVSNVIWRRAGNQNVFSFHDTVEFRPANRKHSAGYSCEARNAVGVSKPATVQIDIKYPPFDIEVGPAPFVTSQLHNHTTLECHAAGNPPPSYTWLQRVEGSEQAQVRGHNASLVIQKVTYSHQGNYVCVATNTIKGSERRMQSEPIRLEVVGAPEVLRYSVNREIHVERGEDALIQMIFCSDPQPRRANWEWGSNHLETGNGNGRYVAETLHKVDGHASEGDCYAARLLVQRANPSDARDYFFNVENERGSDRYAVTLAVREPMSMTVVIGVVVACLSLLVVVTLVVLYTFKTEKWCFSRDGDFKPTDLESHSELDTAKTGSSQPQQTGTIAPPGGRSQSYLNTRNNSAVSSNMSINTSNTTINTAASRENIVRYHPLNNDANTRNHEFVKLRANSASSLYKSEHDRANSSLLHATNVGGSVAGSVATINSGMNRSPNRYKSTNPSAGYGLCSPIGKASSNPSAGYGLCSPIGKASSNSEVAIDGVPQGRKNHFINGVNSENSRKPGAKVPPKVPPKPSSSANSSAPPEYANHKVLRTATGALKSSLELRSPLRNSNSSSLNRDELAVPSDGIIRHHKISPTADHQSQQIHTEHGQYQRQNTPISLKASSYLHSTYSAANYNSLQHLPSGSTTTYHRLDDTRECSLPHYPPTMKSSNVCDVTHTSPQLSAAAAVPHYTTVTHTSLDGSREMPVDVGPNETAADKIRKEQNDNNRELKITTLGNNYVRSKLSDDGKSADVKPKKIVEFNPVININGKFEAESNSKVNKTKEPTKLRNLWQKIISKTEKTAVVSITGDKTNESSVEKNIINSVEAENNEISKLKKSSGLDFQAAQLCYDNPSFSDNTEVNLSMCIFNGQEQLPATNYNNYVSSSETNHYKSSKNINNWNINMKSTSAQTNITSLQLRKTEISKSTPDVHRGSQLALALKPSLTGSNSYITTSNISSEAVVEVAKALRAKMQHQQKQKEYKHRQAMETSSVRYSHRNNISLTDLRDDQFVYKQPNQQYNSQINKPSLFNVSAIIDSFESSTSDFNSSYVSSTNSKQDNDCKVAARCDGSYSYFNHNNAVYYGENDFASIQETKLRNYDDVLCNQNTNYTSLDYTMNNSNVMNDLKSTPLRLKTFQSPKRETADPATSFSQQTNPSKIVYAELTFPNNRAASFNVFNPDKYQSLRVDQENRTNYTTLIYPAPSADVGGKKYEEIEI